MRTVELEIAPAEAPTKLPKFRTKNSSDSTMESSVRLMVMVLSAMSPDAHEMVRAGMRSAWVPLPPAR